MTRVESFNFFRLVQSFSDGTPSPLNDEEISTSVSMVISSSDGLTSSSHLSEFLTEIYEARDDAQANGYPIPKKSTVQNAVRLGKDLFDRLPFRYEAYAGANGEVVIDADGNRDSVLVLCEPDGSAVVMSYMDGVQESTKYSKIGDLPDDSLLEKINSVD